MASATDSHSLLLSSEHHYADAARFDDNYRSFLDYFSRQQQEQQSHDLVDADDDGLVTGDSAVAAANAVAFVDEDAERVRRLNEEVASGVYDDSGDSAALIDSLVAFAKTLPNFLAVADANADAQAPPLEPLVVNADDSLLDEGVINAFHDNNNNNAAAAAAAAADAVDVADDAGFIPPEQPALSGRYCVGTLILDAVSVKFESNWAGYWVAKNQCTIHTDYINGDVTLVGHAKTGQPGADMWCDMPPYMAQRFIFSRVELHNGARLEFNVPKKDELCLNNVFCRSRASNALEFWLGDHCSVINMPTLDNDLGGSQRTVKISLGHKSIFTGKTGATIDHLDLHVRPGATEAELKSYFVKVSARGVFDTIRQVKILLGALQTCSLEWKVNVPGKRAERWHPTVNKANTAPHSAERQAASTKNSRQTVTYRMHKWFSQTQNRIDALKAAAQNRTVLPEAVVHSPVLPESVPSLYQQDIDDTLEDFRVAVQRYQRAMEEAAARASAQSLADSSSSSSSSSSSVSASGSPKRSFSVSLDTDSNGALDVVDDGGDDQCMICQSAPAELFGQHCGHAYYCGACDQEHARTQPRERYFQCALCRRTNQRLVPKDKIARQ